MSQESRSGYLLDLADLLWPSPLRWELSRRGRGGSTEPFQEFVIVPSARAPRMLVPTQSRLAAAALSNSQSGSGIREKLRARGLAIVFRCHLGAAVFRDRLLVWHSAGADPVRADASLKAQIDAATGTLGSWAVPITRARANRKPVLQVLSPDALPVAFVKVGTNTLTRELVRAERLSLDTLSGALSSAQVPTVIDSFDWRELALLLLGPLPLRRRRFRAPTAALTAAALELSHVSGARVRPLHGSTYWEGLRARLSALSGGRAMELLQVWRMLDQHVGEVAVQFGAWHGDWAPWNMAWVDGELLVWDWERFQLDVPVGFDLLHFDLQTRILNPHGDAESVILARLEAAPSLLQPVGVSAGTSYIIFTLYLIEIACRWLSDRQEEAGGSGVIIQDLVRCANSAGARACSETSAEGLR